MNSNSQETDKKKENEKDSFLPSIGGVAVTPDKMFPPISSSMTPQQGRVPRYQLEDDEK